MTPLPPWANGPLELLVHAEEHLRAGDDFDRRIALISFDNAIEVAIATYLTLDPIQRGGRIYANVDVAKWLNNYYTKLDFFAVELSARNVVWEIERSHIVWAHKHRNEQYHGGMKGIPEKQLLALIRKAALWIFGVLFDIVDPDQQLEGAITARTPPTSMRRDDKLDRAIDRAFEMVEVADQTFYASEVLFSVDYAAYCDVGTRLCANPPQADAGEA